MKYFDDYEYDNLLRYCKKALIKKDNWKVYQIHYIDIDTKEVWKVSYCVGDKIPNRLNELVKGNAAKMIDITEKVKNDNQIT